MENSPKIPESTTVTPSDNHSTQLDTTRLISASLSLILSANQPASPKLANPNDKTLKQTTASEASAQPRA